MLKSTKPASSGPADVEYMCPMHKEIRQIGTGTCPKCGMALEPGNTSAVHGGHADHGRKAGMESESHAGHDKHAGHSVAMFRDKFWVSLLLTLPALVWGHMLQGAIGYSAPRFAGSAWIPAVFGTAVFVYGGAPFLKGAVREIRDRLPGMMTLIALAICVAFAFSAAVALGFPGMPLWEELATLVTIMLLGHWIEMRSISQAQGALGEIAKLLPSTASRVTGEGGVESIEEVQVSSSARGMSSSCALAPAFPLMVLCARDGAR